MRPKKHETTGEEDLFRARLDQIIRMKHELVQLAGKLDWDWLDGEIAPLHSDKCRPGIETLDQPLRRCSQATSLIGAVISVSAPFPPPINIRCRGTRDGGNTGGDTSDTNSTLSDIGPIRRACIVVALVAFTPPRQCCRSEGMTTQKFYPRNDITTFR